MSSRIPVLLCAIALALAAGLAACGDDETETVDSPGVDETGTVDMSPLDEADEDEDELTGPTGSLTAGGVGEVQVGASAAEVGERFGEPERTDEAPGCEFASESPSVLIWTYDLGDGELFLTFDAAGEELDSYRTDSPSLETAMGDRVGNRFASVRENWGSMLQAVPLGEVTPQDGFWWVRDGKRELLFDVQGGRVAGISGGDIQFCE